MSSKEIDTLRQKLYYIDTSVNTFFNRTLINIQKSLNDLNVRVSQLENQMSTTSEPNTNNSYKKHIIDYVKKNQNGTRCGFIDIKWNGRDKEYYYKKCWMTFIDNREKRLIILLWDGSQLKR